MRGNEGQPKYVQVMNYLRGICDDREPHSPIPSEREIAATLSISRMTVRKAVEEMVRQGFLYRMGNKGTFIAEKDLKAGAVPEEKRRILFLDSIYDSNNVKEVQKALGLLEHDRLFRLVRLVSAGRSVLRIEEIYAAEGSITDEEIGVIDHVLDLEEFRRMGQDSAVFRPRVLPGKYTNLMELPSGCPVICKEELIRKPGGQPFLFVYTIYNPETTVLQDVLSATPVSQ